MCEAQTEAPEVTNVIIDGAAIVQMLKPGAAVTFEEYAYQVLFPTFLDNFKMCLD